MARNHVQRDVTSMFGYLKELDVDQSGKWLVKEYNLKKKGYDVLGSGFPSKKEALAFARKTR